METVLIVIQWCALIYAFYLFAMLYLAPLLWELLEQEGGRDKAKRYFLKVYGIHFPLSILVIMGAHWIMTWLEENPQSLLTF